MITVVKFTAWKSLLLYVLPLSITYLVLNLLLPDIDRKWSLSIPLNTFDSFHYDLLPRLQLFPILMSSFIQALCCLYV